MPNGLEKKRNPLRCVVRNLSIESLWPPHPLWLR